MTGEIENRLAQMGIVLPDPPAPVAAYIPVRTSGNLVFVSGQLPIIAGTPQSGKLGYDIDIETGVAAARVCAINLLAQVRHACGGDLDKMDQVIKLTGFVNSTPDFTDHPKVVNGASEFLVEVLGDAGKHARSAVGVSSLPFGAPVEIEGIFSLR